MERKNKVPMLVDVLFCQTREELRNALEDEMRGFNVDRDLSTSCTVAWNHQEFEVQYHCLSDEIRIGALSRHA